jgi:transcriptional regulator with XRE-family HTH domain
LHRRLGVALASIEECLKPRLDPARLADAAELHVNQIRRYEAGTAQPTLAALIRLAKVLRVSLDDLVFGEGERGPDEDLRLQSEALAAMSPEEKQVAKAVLEAMIVKNQVSGAIAGTLARANPPVVKEKEGTRAAGSQRSKRQRA